jgi:C1A family cysteine protease
MKNALFIVLFLCLTVLNLHAQKRKMGLIFDDDTYGKGKKTVPLTKGCYDLPASASLEKYCPTPKNQGDYSTCVAWSISYATRTILYAKANNLQGDAINAVAFSPTYTYNLVKESDDKGCQNGTFISRALNSLMTEGVALMTDFSTECDKPISDDIKNKARQYKTRDYKKLFDLTLPSDQKIIAIKKALAEGQPVVIGMKVPESFMISDPVWNRRADEDPRMEYPGHAMAVVGYDDNKVGGAFRIMNSWGTEWADKGFVWIKYNDLADFCKYAYEIIGQSPAIAQLEGNLEFKLVDGSLMPAAKKVFTKGFLIEEAPEGASIKKESMIAYSLKQSYTSGTKFRCYVSNNKAAYMYALASDSITGQVSKMFPYRADISPYMGYSKGIVAIPSETAYMKMDEKKGVDYFCIFYSENALNIDSLMGVMNTKSMNFSEKITSTFGDILIPLEKIKYEPAEIKFSATVSDKKKFVVPLMVQIRHE